MISKQPNPQIIPEAVPLQPKVMDEAIEVTHKELNSNQSDDAPPVAKKQCRQLDFFCIFCKDVFDDSNDLLNHIKLTHPKSLEPKPEKEVKVVVEKPLETKIQPQKQEPSEDEDEGEVNDLIMDIEETQDTAISSQDRSETPESPEFEEHVPIPTIVKQEPIEETSSVERPNEREFEYEDYEYFSSIMEPICELSCEEDSNQGAQDDSEAMRLYREAMEVNYQLNGIKKRGRRKQRKSRPLVENTASLNGILAGLLENSTIKVPPGPGRGRRKEINEKELEMDRSNGICLFSCNK
jgi:hypothetical protein